MDPNIQQPQQQETSQSSLPPQQNIHQEVKQFLLPKIVLIVLGIVLIFGIIGGAYYIKIKNNSTATQNTYAIPTTTSSNTTMPHPSPSPTPTQRIFTDNELEGSFSYPSDWQQNKSSPSDKFSISFSKSICQQEKDTCFLYYVNFAAYPTTFSTTQAFINQYYPGSNDKTVMPAIDYITPRGIQYKKVLAQYNTLPDYFTIQNGRIYVISTSISGRLQDTTQDQTNTFLSSVQQLLNSFSFSAVNISH